MTEADTAGMNRSSSDVQQDLSGDAQRLKDSAKQRAAQEAGAGKRQAASAARSTSSALDKAAEELRNDDNAPEWLSSAFEKTAQEIDRFAGGLEGKDVKAIRRDVTDFARRSPAAFLGASAAAGFAAARFLRAGAEYQSDHRQDGRNRNAGSGGSPGAANREGATL